MSLEYEVGRLNIKSIYHIKNSNKRLQKEKKQKRNKKINRKKEEEKEEEKWRKKKTAGKWSH